MQKSFVFPDKSISLLRKQASYVKSVMLTCVNLYGIERPDIKDRLFVFMDVYLMHLHDVQVKILLVI